ncbi:ferric reductase-like transmembrane domain-containing protein [bacterium]|nr:ferric reductase-like transmembrane domain-containing protein [bacterium]
MLAFDAATGGLGTNPAERLERATGIWALRLLLATLAITPIFKLTRQSALVRLRRPLGVAAFLYALVHLFMWGWLEAAWSWEIALEEVANNRFVIAGLVGFFALLPLALTSTNAALKRMGAARWRALHLLAYLAGGAGVMHFLWKVKPGVPTPYPYIALFLLLMVVRALKRKRPAKPS